MATVFYSMCGHGQGHASRAQAILEALGTAHDFILFCPGDAYDYLAPRYHNKGAQVLPLPLCLRMAYRRNRVSLGLTTWRALLAFRHLGATVAWLEQQIALYRPTVALVDLEPALPRAAARCGVPWLSVDNQHRCVVEPLGPLPPALKLSGFLTGLFTRWICPNPTAILIPTIGEPARKCWHGRPVHRTGPLLRNSVRGVRTADDGYLMAYLRDSLPDSAIEALARCPIPVRAFGLGKRPSRGSITFGHCGEAEFIATLARCRALLSTAGHQLLCEAAYLRKPVFLLPEAGHAEQAMNAHLAREAGMGEWCAPCDFSSQRLNDFLNRLPEFSWPAPEPGTDTIRRLIASYIRDPETNEVPDAYSKPDAA